MALDKGQKNDDKTSLSEASIQFQIQVKKKEIQEFNNETSLLEAKNKQLIELRAQLREEQLAHVRALRRQAREQERTLEQSERVSKETVEQALQNHLELRHRHEEELGELLRTLTGLETELRLQLQQKVLLEYKSTECVEHHTHIQVLQSQLTALQKDFQEMSEHIRCSHESAINEIDKKKSQLIDEVQQLAPERVIKRLDKGSRHKIMENDLLKREVAMYSKEVHILEESVRNLEEKNLKHIEQLVDQRLSDLQFSRNVFLTQAAGLQQMNLGNIEQPMQEHILSETAELGSRPWPAPVEPVGEEQQWARLLEGDETEPGRGAAAHGTAAHGTAAHGTAAHGTAAHGTAAHGTTAHGTSAPPYDLAVLPCSSRSDHRELLHLGQLDQKLLTVIGQAMTLHPMPSDPESCGESTHLDVLEVQDWALTTRIIHSTFP
ncbi:coiled-coil domain-containing protein 83 [Brachyhypopomus gauderio]|uniref:coiled-coil domain-containing protein 83 n=1 Tax=Brachyhypopomus gauderio TaxID=698409 RepID=UPI004041334F